jgi:hypothetical protein
MPLKPLTKKKRKIKVLLILLGKGFLTDAQIILFAMALLVFFDAIKNKADESQLNPGEAAHLELLDTWYATADANEDPDNFDACAVTALSEDFATAAAEFCN